MHGFELLSSAAASALQLIADAEVRSVFVWALAGTLLWSGSSKIRRPLLAATALMRFGLVKTAPRIYGQLLGVAELVLAALLVARVAPLFALATATALFTAFAILIGGRLRAGDTRPCYCFGSDAPLGSVALARATGLAIVAGVLSATAPRWAPPPELGSIGWYAAGAGALMGVAALVAALPTVMRLTSTTERS
jgi:hypothetical protein